MASLLAFDRLGITCKEALLFDGGNPVGAAANKPYAHEAVSYTHLDVYKRQPFNLIKAVLNAVLTLVVYKSISNLVTPKKKQVKGRK